MNACIRVSPNESVSEYEWLSISGSEHESVRIKLVSLQVNPDMGGSDYEWVWQ